MHVYNSISKTYFQNENVLDKRCGENPNLFYIQLFFFENHVVFEIMCEEYGWTRQAKDDSLPYNTAQKIFCLDSG
jgi:hypothetical protein